MKKLIALLLAALLVLSMAACGAAEPVPAPAAPAPAAPAAPEETPADAPAEAPETAPTESGAPALSVLTPEQADSYYQAIAGGEVTGIIADFLLTQEEDTAKLYLDTLAMIFGDNLLETIRGFSAQEQDQIMAEVHSMVSDRLAPPEEAQEEEVWIDPDVPATTMVLYNSDLDSSIRVRLNELHAFMEPDWARYTDMEDNYFYYIDNNYDIYTLGYRRMTAPTDALMDDMKARYEYQHGDCTVSEVRTFTAGGLTWEMFTLSHVQTSYGIDKETNQQVELTDTIYDTMCFARVNSGSILQLITGSSANPDIMDFYEKLVTSCISFVDVGESVG